MSVTYLPGTWTDVTVLPDGRFAQVTTDGPTVRCFVEGVLIWQRDAPIAVGQCRAASTPQGVLSIHQGNKEGDPDDGVAFLIGEHSVTQLGKTFGAQSVAIDGQFAYIVRSTQHYERVRLSDGHVDENLPHGWPGGQGISDVVDGAIWWADLKRTLSVNGLTLTYPNAAGAVTVGQRDPAQIAGVVNGVPFTAIQGDAFEPHIAQSGDRYAIVARTPKGAAFVVVPPFPAFVSGAPAPIPVPVPQPKPEEPKPVNVQNRAAALADFHAQWNGGQPITDDAEKHRFTEALAAKLIALDGSGRWGRKARAGTDAKSKDTLGYWLGVVTGTTADGKIDAFDVIASNGAVSWDLRAEQNDPGYHNIDARWFPVAAVSTGPDTLPPGGGPAPLPPAPPTPTVSPEYLARLSAIEDALRAVEDAGRAQRDAMATLAAAVKLLGEKPAPKYSGTAKLGATMRFNLEPIA